MRAVRKALAAVAGVAAEATNAGLVHGTAAHWVAVLIAIAVAVGVYAVPNQQALATTQAGIGPSAGSSSVGPPG